MEVTTKRIFWSEESARIYGHAPGTEPTSDLILQRVHPEDVGLFKEALERAARGVLELLRNNHVGTVPLSSFYGDGTDTGMIRLSFCKDDEILLEGGRRLSQI